jgi:hypothetical protein
MAIAVILDFAGATLQQYDEVIKLMGLAPGGPGPAGSLAHWSAATEDGLRVVDVWSSREAFDSFAQNSIGPMTAKVGMGAPTSMEFFEVHNTFTAG